MSPQLYLFTNFVYSLAIWPSFNKIWINIESGTNSKRTSEKRKINTQNKNNKNTKHKDYDIPLDGVVELKRRKIFGRFKDKIRV